MKDPGVGVRRRISFRSTNLIGSFHDDSEISAAAKADAFRDRYGTSELVPCYEA
jgi:hypothetical protein